MRTARILTTGTALLMWLGEQIDAFGIGNGMSMLIFIGIIARLPCAGGQEYSDFITNDKSIFLEIFVLCIIAAVTALTVMLTQGTRKIPVQYAKRVVGRRVYGGQTTHIPLKVNVSGVMPIIFAQAIMFMPSTLASFFPNVEVMQQIAVMFSPGGTMASLPYWILYSLMIIFFVSQKTSS